MGRDPKSPRAQPSRERAVSDCTFYVNEADNEGGGIYNQESAPVLTNCIFWENTGGASFCYLVARRQNPLRFLLFRLT